MSKRFEQWGYESFKDNETSEIKSDYIELLNEQNDKIGELEAKLAEKEKEYQELLNFIKIKDLSNINFIQVNEDIIKFSESGVIYEYNKKDNAICKIIDQAHQDKISFALEQLEKVKDHYRKFKNTNMGIIKRADIVLFIDNQIEELKKGENNE